MNIDGTCPRSRESLTGKATSEAVCIIVIALLALSPALAEQYVMQIGSKSNPNAHLFSYDQKFSESTNLHNYDLGMSASKEFTDTTRLASRMDLRAFPNVTEMTINADFIGIGRLEYVVLNSDTGDVKDEMSRINHMFVGNFSLDEQITVARDHMEGDYCGCLLSPV
jgi:hypothetical protein